jgi:hypothetical protein
MRSWSIMICCLALLTACGVSSDVSREVGARCTEDGDCDEVCLSGRAYPDGLCSVGCRDDDDCPSGSVCVRDEDGTCQIPCDEDRNCEYLGAEWECHGTRTPDGDEVNVCRG